MKNLFLILFLIASISIQASEVGGPDCQEVRVEMVQRVQKLDSVFKLRQSYLLGEISQSAPAIRQCLAENQAVNSRVFLIWFAVDFFLILIGTLSFWSHKLSRQAIRVLSSSLHEFNSNHPANYQPNQWPHRLQWGAFILCIILVNFIALLF
jgi:hypothetical protein